MCKCIHHYMYSTCCTCVTVNVPFSVSVLVVHQIQSYHCLHHYTHTHTQYTNNLQKYTKLTLTPIQSKSPSQISHPVGQPRGESQPLEPSILIATGSGSLASALTGFSQLWFDQDHNNPVKYRRNDNPLIQDL